MNDNVGDVRCEPARTEHAAPIVSLFRAGFAPHVVELTIYGAARIERFVEEQIAIQDSGGETQYTVATTGKSVLGAVEMRRLGSGLFLNYIAVHPGQRGTGLANRLLRSAIDQTRPSHLTEMALDVLEGNDRALQWYRRLGFTAARSTHWWTMTHSALSSGQTSNKPLTIQGYAQAQACQQEFGFSRFSLITDLGAVEVGRLGNRWFRITDPRLLELPEFSETLRRIDADRALLVLAPPVFRPPTIHARCVTTTHRYTNPLAELRERLAHRGCRTAPASRHPCSSSQ